MPAMKQPASANSNAAKPKIRLPKDAARLVHLSEAAVGSASRAESLYWQALTETLASELMDRGNDKALEAALEHTHKQTTTAPEFLVAACEAAAESCVVTVDGISKQAVLVSIPLITWSKYQIPAGALSESAIAPLRSHLHGHILGRDVSLCLNPFLYSIDQLPRGFSDTRALLKTMTDAAMHAEPAEIDYASLGDAAMLPADVRFLLGVVVANFGSPLFQWQEIDGKDSGRSREDCLQQWSKQTRAPLATLLPGCEFECGLPNAYFSNCREADIRIRPFTLVSNLSAMTSLLDAPPSAMAAVVASVGDGRVDEYRVSITRRGQNDVLNGVVWPLYGDEDEDDDTNPSPREAIETLLRENKLGDVTLLEGVRSPEYCEDCGAPLFYTHDGEAVHAHLPDDVEHPTAHFH